MGKILQQVCFCRTVARRFSCVPASCGNARRCQLLVVGGGTGGCSVAWRFSRVFKPQDIIVLDPSEFHYYQPLFTLIAAGVKKFDRSVKPLQSVLPNNVQWLRDSAETFDPCYNTVYTKRGNSICYDYMVIATGLLNDYDRIPGLKQALDNPKSGVCTIYSPDYCVKTWCCLSQLKGGHAVFTFTNKASKCSGAAQKIMYMADDYFRKHNVRNTINMTYNTGGETMFGVPKYAESLTGVARTRGIAVNCKTELVEVTPSEAKFAVSDGRYIVLPYNLLHVTPPMIAPNCITKCSQLAADTGFLNVDKHTLQHKSYPNIYGVGDCLNTPNSKTAAAVAQQSWVVEQNLRSTISGREPMARYDGYGACPILTSYSTGILTEFVYDKKPHETFPFDQSKERKIFYYLKRDYFPLLYWNKLIRGKWDGPENIRKFINPFGR